MNKKIQNKISSPKKGHGISSQRSLLSAQKGTTQIPVAPWRNILPLSKQKQTKPRLFEGWGSTKSERDNYKSDQCVTIGGCKANLPFCAKCSVPICSLEWTCIQNWFHPHPFLSQSMFLRELPLSGIITWCPLSCKQFTIVFNPPG